MLERANLFLIPLDDRRVWYRYRHLFADVIGVRLLDEEPAVVAGLCPASSPPSAVGAPILLASAVATLFGVYDQVSGAALLLVLPIAIWEFSLGVWLTVKGFRAPVVSDPAAVSTASPAVAAV